MAPPEKRLRSGGRQGEKNCDRVSNLATRAVLVALNLPFVLCWSGVRFERKTCIASPPDCCCCSRLQATSPQLPWRPIHSRRTPAAGVRVLIPATILPRRPRNLSSAMHVAPVTNVAAPRLPRGGHILSRALRNSLLAALSDSSGKRSRRYPRRTLLSLIPRAHLLLIPRSLEIRVAQPIRRGTAFHRETEG